MKTIITIVLLVISAGITSYLTPILLNIAGLPGALFMFPKKEKRSKSRFILGVPVSALGQSYVYLSYTAFIVSWTMNAASRADVVGFLVWPIAFLAVFVPLSSSVLHSEKEIEETGIVGVQSVALRITLVVALLGFFVFAFEPTLMDLAWGWVPFVGVTQ